MIRKVTFCASNMPGYGTSAFNSHTSEEANKNRDPWARRMDELSQGGAGRTHDSRSLEEDRVERQSSSRARPKWAGSGYLAGDGVKYELARRFHDLFCHQSWNVGIVNAPIRSFLEDDARPSVQWLPPLGKGKYLADPFGLTLQGQTYIFCEEFDYQSYKGIIVGILLSEEGFPISRRIAIQSPFHMSYPYILEYGGHIYCVPETHEAREIGLYRPDEFPNRWSKTATLVPNFSGVDPTIFPHDGRWWMLCTDSDTGPNEALFAFHAPNPLGPWQPHRANPIKRGSSGTRPGGTPFIHKGELYRPAMDCSTLYGKQIVINRVKRLTPNEFEEEPVKVIGPFARGRYRDGFHTLSSLGDKTLVDALQLTFEKTEYKRAIEYQTRDFLGWLTPLWHKSGKGSGIGSRALRRTCE